MNTKQLWNALILNPVTNKYFDGIFSIDTLQDIKEKPTLIICNTDPSYKPGEHWILFFFYNKSVDFFDSLLHIMDLNSLILLKILLMIINTLLNEHSQSEVMYVDIIVCIMLLKNVMTYLCKKLFLIFLIMTM